MPQKQQKEQEPCSSEIDRNAPAGSATSLGSKSDCNGRPATDDSVVEAMDELGPAGMQNSPQGQNDKAR